MDYIEIDLDEKSNLILKFKYDQAKIEIIKKIFKSAWNPFERYWEIPYTKANLAYLNFKFPNKLKYKDSYYLSILFKELKIRQYSKNTEKAYYFYNIKLLEFSKKRPYDINQTDIKRFLYHLAVNQNYSNSTLNLVINALKFYYFNILKKAFIYSIKRPKKSAKLPEVLNKTEIMRIFNAVKNIKHKTIIMLIYSSGLRVSEASNLKKTDIDIQRKLVYIRNSKGQKDRYTILSAKLIPVLMNYYKSYSPAAWLFEGMNKTNNLRVRTIQKLFERACEKAGITKNVSVHSLRHSFATHLLESGINIRYIQELLGHKSSKTTEIYTHVAQNKIQKINSPLDEIAF